MEFYILNQNEEVTATLSTDSTGEHTPVYSAVVDEKLGSYDTLELSIPSGVEHDLDIKEEYYIVFEDIKGFREYIINEVVDVDDGEISRTITAELSSIELLDEIIQTNLTGNNPTTILTNMLKNTRWTIGNVDPSIYNSAFSEETEMVSVLEGIDLLSSSFNAEVSFSYAVAGNKITKRFVNLHKQMGANNGKRFEVDKDVTSIKRTIDTSSIKTAIIPFGAEPEEGKARLSIKDLVWSKAAGNPVDKPKGQEWIGDPTALANWGKNNADGSRRHRFIAQEINVETAAELATMAWVHLGQYTKPKTTYEAVAMDLYTLTGDEDLKHEYVNLGDTVVITDYYFAQPLVVQTRVSELKRDLLEPLNNDLVFGDSLELFSTSKQADRLETIKKELSNRIELVRQSADGKSDTYMGSDEPISPNGKDMWYRPHPTIPNETQFLIFNGLTWDIILDTSNLDSVGKEVIAIIEQADRDREQAEADFESAKTAAKAYTDTKASEFDTKVEAVKTDLAATKIKADKAITDAQTAIAEAGFAKVDATTAKQNAVTAISTAETAKTNAANALTNAATAISTANTAKTNAGTALTTAQTSLTNSGTALTNAQTALDAYNNLEIGGRNLLIGTTDAKTDFNFAQNGNAYRISPNNIDTFLKGGAYTVSVEVTDWEIGTMPIGVMVSYRLLGGGAIQQFFSYSNTLVNPKTGTITNTFILPNMSTTSVGYIEVHLRTEQNVTAKGKFRKMMLSKGTKATDWTPAPEDIQVQITDINGELSRKVAQTTFDTLNGTVTNQGTQISQSQTAIGLKADKTLVDTINQTVANHTLSIKATADSLATKAEKSLVDTINQTVTKHTTDIKATSDGLALKSDKSVVDSINSTVNTHTSQIKATSDGLALKADSTLVNTVKGTVDTHTTQIKATSDGLALKAEKSLVDTINSTVGTHTTQIKATSDGLALKAEKSLVDTVKSTVDTHTTQIKATSDGLALKAESNLVNTINGTVNTHTGQISANSTAIAARLTSAQVESLVAAKKYVNETTLNATANGLNAQITQVSTDLGETDTKVTSIEATVNGINTVVGTKASQTQVTQLATQVSTKVESATYNSKMTQLDSAINLRVVQSDVTAAILADKTIKDTRATNELPSWYFANYPKQTVEEFKQRATMGVTGSATYGQLTTKVIWNSTSGGVITQIFSSSDGVFQRQGNSGATAWLAWDKVAEAGKLISQINVSTEGILLQGKRIQLDGDVTMTSAFVTDIKAKSLEAVYADIATLKTKVLTADVITSTMLKSDTALITKLFATDANIGVLTSKSAFINSVKAVDISADRITAGTLNAANVNIINLNADRVTSGTFNGLTFTNPYSINGLTGTTVLKGDLTSSYTKTNGQYGTMAFSRDRIFSNLYNTNGSLVTGYNLSSEALNFNSSFGSATYNFDNIRVARNDGANSEIIFAYTGYGMQIHSDYGIKLGRHYFGKKETLIEVGTGNSPDVRFGADVSLLTHDIYNVGKIRFNAESYITAPTADGLDLRARSFTKFTLSGWDAMYLTRDGSTGTNNMDMYGNLNMQGKIDMKTNGIANAGRINFNDQSYVDAPNADSSRLNARTYTAFTLSGWDVMYLVRDQNTGNNRMDMYGNINMNSFQLLNNSDRRLKQNIQTTKVTALDAYRNLNVVDYEWRDPRKPQGRHLGVIAQETPFWSEYDASTDIWNISSSKQIMYNSLGIKELTSIVDSHTQILQNLNLENRIKELEFKIKQLESGI